jgi:hypothetical protein
VHIFIDADSYAVNDHGVKKENSLRINSTDRHANFGNACVLLP